MSSAALLSTLQQLGYPQADQLDAASLDWLFEHDAVGPFLDWFCATIQPTNLVSSKEQQEFAELEVSAEGILEGAQLEEALQNLSACEHSDVTLDRLRSEVEQLEEEIQMCSHRKQVLTQHRNKLNVHQLAVSERVSQLDPVEVAAKQEYRHHLQHAQEDNNKMTDAAHQVSHAVRDLLQLYASVGSDSPREDNRSQPASFLSQLDLQNYHTAEEKFGAQLASFTKKQFFEGIADIASEGEATRFEFLEISKPVQLLVRGERHEVNLEECKELARLQACYPRSECRRVNALVQHRSTQAACKFAEDKARHIKQRPYPASVKELGSCLGDVESALASVQRDMDCLAQQQVPTLIRESAALQVTKILRGDYNLKIARQDYFTSNQDQLIGELLRQQARHDLLKMGYELELTEHRHSQQLLTAVTLLLQQMTYDYTDRMQMMEDSLQVPARHKRGTVDSRDKFITNLHSMLDSESGQSQQLFLTYASLSEHGNRVHQQLAGLRAAISATTGSQDDKLARLEDQLRACESMVYQGSSTRAGPPPLCPPAVLDALTQLEAMHKKVEQAVRDVIKEVDQKKKMLKIDPLLNMERNLFVYFFTHPSRLRSALDDVQNRLQAALGK